MKKTTILFISFLLTVNFVFACLNETRVLLNGQITISDEPTSIPYGHNFNKDREYYKKELLHLDSLWKEEKKIDDYSDYGVVLVYLGEYQKALKVFQDIEVVIPGLYTTAANIGTTYELLGKNELAYDWIGKAIKIDPASHDSSEWLHLKILEVKIKGDKYINTKFLIGTEFGDDTIPKSNLTIDQLQSLKYAIYYQLNERVSFIKPQDKIVALLLYELGNICAITDDATSAFRVYEKAKEYGYSSEVFKKRFEIVRELQKIIEPKIKTTQKDTQTTYSKPNNLKVFIFAGGLIILILMVLIIWKRRK